MSLEDEVRELRQVCERLALLVFHVERPALAPNFEKELRSVLNRLGIEWPRDADYDRKDGHVFRRSDGSPNTTKLGE
jgi:hypothetical protein